MMISYKGIWLWKPVRLSISKVISQFIERKWLLEESFGLNVDCFGDIRSFSKQKEIISS